MSTLPHLHFLGHSTVRIELDGLRILTDPLVRPILGPLIRTAPAPEPATYRDIDLVLVSHLHLDHLDIGSLRLLDRGPRLVVPKGATSLLAQTHHHDIVEMLPGDSLTIGGVRIRATRAEHPGNRRPGGLQGVAMGFLVEGSTERIYFAGDTDLFPEMSELDAPDIALLPVSGWGLTRGRGHLDPKEAADALNLIRPRFAVPIHWGTLWPRGLTAIQQGRRTGAGGHFATFAREIAPEVHVVVAQPGHRVNLGGGHHA